MALFSNHGRFWLFLVATLLVRPSSVQAQIVPDDTLGIESSSLVLDQLVRGEPADLIEGGALRDSNLFHSFSEFNVDENQRVYFANPADVGAILSRVIGENPSEIFGTLGVDGPASLFLINPNGLVFGENAQLDIEGSFYGTTADGVAVGSEVFSAVVPDQQGLLNVNPSVAFWHYLTTESGDIISHGTLSSGGDLVLAGQNLDLQNQVAAFGDVSLLATDGITIRDTAEVPFIALAGDELLVQGNQQVDIVALSHPESGLFSYGDMVLRSAERVGGDAHYLSGGNFRVEQLDGSDGELYSPIDPIIRSQGDVSFSTYLGASLHILAGGAVDIGTVFITGPDLTGTAINPVSTPGLTAVELSDGTTLIIDGSTRPTVDIRAGVNPIVIGDPLGTLGELSGVFFDATLTPTLSPNNNPIATSANITIGDIFINAPNGLVLLTNQYELAANELAGDIVVNGEGVFGIGINAQNFNGKGGTVYLDARNNIEVLNSSISTTAATQAGDIVLIADNSVTFDSLGGTRLNGASSDLLPWGTGSAGNIHIKATTLNVLNGAQLSSRVLGNGQGGDISISILATALFAGNSPRNGIASGVFSDIQPNGSGKGGDVRIQARNLEVLDGAQLSAASFGQGNAGNVILVIEETARFVGSNPRDGIASGVFSAIGPNGNGMGGDVRIQAQNLEVLDGAAISSDILGQGNAGNVILIIEETARFVGSSPRTVSGALSRIGANGSGKGGDVRIQARNLEVLDGARLNASTVGQGDAGSVILVIEETARFVGSDPRDDSSSGAFSAIGPNGTGMGGDVRIQARNLQVLNGAQLNVNNLGQGDAGSVILIIEETARFVGSDPRDNSASGAFSVLGLNGNGMGGDVRIQARNIEVLDGAQLSVSSLGQGDAGNMILIIEETARFVGSNPRNGSVSLVSSDIYPNAQGNGGDVRIQARNLEVLHGAAITAVSSGQGNAGNVILVIEEVAQFVGMNPGNDSASTASSSIQPGGQGTGGNVRIQARNLEVLDRAQISAATFGQGNAGSVILIIEETARFEGSNSRGNIASGVFSSVQQNGNGTGGDVRLSAENVEINTGAVLFSASLGQGNAGNVFLFVRDRLTIRDGLIATNAQQDAGGKIQIGAGNIFLFGDSDIQTFVNSGENDGGNITIRANALVALDDSDILAFAADGRGGDVDLSETAFFGQNFQFAPPGTDPRTLDNNDRVDINATGGIASGTISLADINFVEDSLTELPDNLVNPETLVASSCITRASDTNNSFTITGSDGLREQSDSPAVTYNLETVQAIPNNLETAVAEPQGTYYLADGRLLLGRDC